MPYLDGLKEIYKMTEQQADKIIELLIEIRDKAADLSDIYSELCSVKIVADEVNNELKNVRKAVEVLNLR